jgi:hypothetical protein
MTDQSGEVVKAIVAHSQWKQYLKKAIETGSSEFKPAVVGSDNQCEFGKWFYALPAAQRSSAQATKIKELHASFHKEAAQILTQALTGHKEDAQMAMGFKSSFAKISGELVNCLTDWKEN